MQSAFRASRTCQFSISPVSRGGLLWKDPCTSRSRIDRHGSCVENREVGEMFSYSCTAVIRRIVTTGCQRIESPECATGSRKSILSSKQFVHQASNALRSCVWQYDKRIDAYQKSTPCTDKSTSITDRVENAAKR